jgi:hypothetical protein
MRARVLLLPLALAAALVSGCTTTPGATPTPTPTPTTNGLEALSADEIIKKSTDALDSAKSFRAKGVGVSEGTKIEIDLQFAGDDVKGTIKSGGLNVEVISVSGASYMKADAEFWKTFLPDNMEATVLPLVAGKYVKVPAGSAGGLVPKAAELFESNKTWSKDGTTTVNGKPAITVTDGDNKVNISLVGTPYPLNIVSKEGTIELSDYDAAVTISAPPPAEVFDLAALIP